MASPGGANPAAVARHLNRSPPLRRLLRWPALGVLGLLAAACSDVFGVEDVLGIWNTQSINGHSVPGTVVYEGETYDTQYVRWTFYEGGQCTLTQRVDGVTATYDRCEYTVNPEERRIAIVLLSEQWDGTVEGTTMTLTDPQDVVWVLSAQ